MTQKIGSALIPLFYLFGEYWSVITGIFVVVGFTKICLGMIVRMYWTYRKKGCGIWILAGKVYESFTK